MQRVSYYHGYKTLPGHPGSEQEVIVGLDQGYQVKGLVREQCNPASIKVYLGAVSLGTEGYLDRILINEFPIEEKSIEYTVGGKSNWTNMAGYNGGLNLTRFFAQQPIIAITDASSDDLQDDFITNGSLAFIGDARNMETYAMKNGQVDANNQWVTYMTNFERFGKALWADQDYNHVLFPRPSGWTGLPGTDFPELGDGTSTALASLSVKFNLPAFDSSPVGFVIVELVSSQGNVVFSVSFDVTQFTNADRAQEWQFTVQNMNTNVRLTGRFGFSFTIGPAPSANRVFSLYPTDTSSPATAPAASVGRNSATSYSYVKNGGTIYDNIVAANNIMARYMIAAIEDGTIAYTNTDLLMGAATEGMNPKSWFLGRILEYLRNNSGGGSSTPTSTDDKYIRG